MEQLVARRAITKVVGSNPTATSFEILFVILIAQTVLEIVVEIGYDSY